MYPPPPSSWTDKFAAKIGEEGPQSQDSLVRRRGGSYPIFLSIFGQFLSLAGFGHRNQPEAKIWRSVWHAATPALILDDSWEKLS